MQEHFLKEIEIIDYKCFKDFKAKNFKRVNLISGKNNVGKTALVEAIYINVNSNDFIILSTSLVHVKLQRNLLELVGKTFNHKNYIESFKKISNYESNSNIFKSKFSNNNKNGIQTFNFIINNKITNINSNKFSFEIKHNPHIHFIDNFRLDNIDLKNVFESVQKQDKEEILYNYINNFDNSIINFKLIGGDKPSCKTTSSKEYRDINEFGDGLKHYISIICSLYASENGQLFIDEIDNGIHYTQLEKLWEIIFTISKEVNCQVFATTHSKEMINAFAKVSKTLEDDDISFIELGRNKNNEIKANTYDKEMLEYELNQNHEVRGW